MPTNDELKKLIITSGCTIDGSNKQVYLLAQQFVNFIQEPKMFIVLRQYI